MSTAATCLLDSVLALPEAERLAIAETILSSLPVEDLTQADDDAFAAELRRRSEEMDRDPSMCVPWSEVKQQL